MPPQARPARTGEDLASLDVVLKPDDMTAEDGCILCGVWEGIMLTVFSDTDAAELFLDEDEDEDDSADSEEDDFMALNPSGMAYIALSPQSSQLSPASMRRTPSPRTVCRAWKRKRKQKHKEAMALRSEPSNDQRDAEPSLDVSTADLSCPSLEDRQLQRDLKRSAQVIQKSFESQSSCDYVYRYEKYGSRGNLRADRSNSLRSSSTSS